ncbi:hypothetical protein D3C75_834010 [compost metagenome]
MALKASGFFAFEPRLARFKALFGFSGAFGFQLDFTYLGFFLTEILHQRNIAWANVGASPAFDAIFEIMGLRFIVLLPTAKPVELLWQKICRAGISAGAATNAALFFLLLTHFESGRCQQTVGNFDDRNIQPRQAKAH